MPIVPVSYPIYVCGTSGPSCDEEGWKFYNDACWYISKDEEGERDVSWLEARGICMEKGGELASLHSSQENAVISRLVSKPLV